MEASIEWMAAKDMAAVVDVQFLRRISFGIRTTVHICNLCLKGKVMTLTFSPALDNKQPELWTSEFR